MNLFKKELTTLKSGKVSGFKIECDALTEKDWECLAYIISEKIKFSSVLSVPSGGDKLATCLSAYCQKDVTLPLLICDDVLTTGNSMEIKKAGLENVIGVVVFARGECPDWITPLFQMT